MRPRTQSLAILLIGCWPSLPLAAQQCTQVLAACQPPEPVDTFASSQALDGQRLAVGNRRGDVVFAGSTHVDAGFLCLYEQQPGPDAAYRLDWVPSGQLHALVPAAGAEFGSGVSMHGDFLLVGAEGANEGHLFEWVGGNWLPRQVVQDPTAGGADWFGKSVLLTTGWAVIGAPRAAADQGEVHVYQRQGSTLVLHQSLPAPPSSVAGQFGDEVVLSGDTLLVGAWVDARSNPLGGAVYIYRLDPTSGQWLPTGTFLEPPNGAANGDRFGDDLAFDGERAFVACGGDDTPGQNRGAVHVYTASNWAHEAALTPDQWVPVNPSNGVEVAQDGDTVVMAKAGLQTQSHIGVAVFRRTGTSWSQKEWIPASLPAATQHFNALQLQQGTVMVGQHGAQPQTNVHLLHTHCLGALGTPYCFCTTEAVTGCGNASAIAGCGNSTGAGAQLLGMGSKCVQLDDSRLRTSDLPPGQPGLYFMGGASTAAPFAFGDGYLCAAGGATGLFRYPVVNSGPNGVVWLDESTLGSGLVEYSCTRFGPNGCISSGSSWYFQFWYRDPQGPCGGFFNLSNGLEVMFE